MNSKQSSTDNTPAFFQVLPLIFTSPARYWAKVKALELSAKVLCSYLLILAAIPAFSGLIGKHVIGQSLPYLSSLHTPLWPALLSQITLYCGLVAVMLVAALLVSMLSPGKSVNLSLKFIIFSCLPFFLGGVLLLVPWFRLIIIIPALYPAFLFIIGVQSLLGLRHMRRFLFCLVSLPLLYLMLASVFAASAALAPSAELRSDGIPPPGKVDFKQLRDIVP